MNSKFRNLPLDERIQLVEDLWDSIAVDQGALPLNKRQIAELDRRLDAFATDGKSGRKADNVIAEIRKQL